MKTKLTIHSDTFIWTNEKKGLMYNSQNGSYMLFNMTDEIENLCKHFNDFDNLYSIIFNTENLKPETNEFIQNIINKRLGVSTDVEKNIVSLPPLLNILNDVEKLKQDKNRSEGENILKYFSALTVYTGGKCKNKDYYKQTFYPYCSDKILHIKEITDFLNKIKSPYLNNINIVFSDISNYQDLHTLIDYLKTLQTPVTIYVHYSEIAENINILNKLTAENFTVKIICEADSDLKNVLSICKNTLYQYDFLIKNENEYNICEQIIDDSGIENYTVIPVFDDNLHFFENNVFISEDDILETKLNKREIFAHQAVNTNFFGTLTVLPDGKIYSNPNFEPIGTIYDSIYDLIITEFHKNNSWRFIRNEKPCCNCIYQWLCPSPSNYEFVIGKMNLCSVVLE